MDYVPEISALIMALMVCGYKLYKHAHDNVSEKGACDIGSLCVVFVIVFSITFFVVKMGTDSTDNKQVFNNIKSGDPPF